MSQYSGQEELSCRPNTHSWVGLFDVAGHGSYELCAPPAVPDEIAVGSFFHVAGSQRCALFIRAALPVG